MVDMARLHGLSLEKAECYGKPNVGARYFGNTPKAYERTEDTCCICGRPATNCHHVVPLSVGQTFWLTTSVGSWELKSPLFALCGSGTTGCHNDFHGGSRLRARWVWDHGSYERAWWSGELLSEIPPHDPALYRFGRWEVLDRETGRTETIRELP